MLQVIDVMKNILKSSVFGGIEEIFEVFLRPVHTILGWGQQHTIPTVHSVNAVSLHWSVKDMQPQIWQPLSYVEVRPAISSRTFSTLRTSPGSFPIREVIFHFPRASFCSWGSDCQGPSLRTAKSLCTQPLCCRWWAHECRWLFGLSPTRPFGQRSGHQVLAVVPRPQACLQEGAPVTRFRARETCYHPCFTSQGVFGLRFVWSLPQHFFALRGPTRGIMPKTTELLGSLGLTNPSDCDKVVAQEAIFVICPLYFSSWKCTQSGCGQIYLYISSSSNFQQLIVLNLVNITSCKWYNAVNLIIH